MYVVLLGAPGAGKGTQAPIVAQAIGGVHLSSGDMLREAVRKSTIFGQQARKYMDLGQLVPDETVLGMVMERLSQPDAKHAFVLDGFPRNVRQAEVLDQALAGAGKKLDFAIYINVPRDVLLARLSGRWTCVECQAIYHEIYNPPTQPLVCDRCGGTLRQRPDDRAEAVENRLQIYLEETIPLVDYYDSRDALRQVDGNQALPRVTADLLATLEGGRGTYEV